MSSMSKDNRPKLKAKRFNKFEPSSETTLEDKDVSTKQGIKRTNDDNNSNEVVSCKQRKFCQVSSYNIPPSTTKNLANNRLQRLKEQIQADVKSRNVNNRLTCEDKSERNIVNENISDRTNRINMGKSCNTNYKLHEQNAQKNIVKTSEDSASRHLSGYEINKTTDCGIISPNYLHKKNVANERLQNIKKCYTLNSSSSSSEIQDKIKSSRPVNSQCSTIKINGNKTVGDSKRKINNLINSNDYEIFENHPKCLAVEQSILSTVIINNTPSDTQHNYKVRKSYHSSVPEQSFNTSISNVDVPRNNTNIHPCHTPVSQRLNVKSNNSTECFNDLRNKSSTTQSTSTLEKLSSIEKTKCEDGNNIFKSPIDSPFIQKLSPNQQNFPHTFPSQINCSNNFLNKMAMTASWIRNHQDLSKSESQVDNKELLSASDNSVNTSSVENTNTAKFDNETEDMEWTNAEPVDEIIGTKRDIEDNTKKDRSVIKDPEKLKDVCVVVDTNVFISGLSKLQDIINLKLTGAFQPFIYIPWMVITELDYMKDSCSDAKLKKNITNSIKFINTSLKEKNPRIIGQTVFDMDKQKNLGRSPDDKIISCCLQVAEKYETVILLSNDINLKNKAMINNLSACSTNEVMVKIMSKLAKNTQSQKIMHKMGMMCSTIICECAKSAFGNIWIKMDLLSNPPWSLAECLKRFQKYWGTVFKEKLMKQFTKTMNDLLHLLQLNKYICDDSEEFIEFMKLCVTLCIFLKDIEEHRGFVENTLNDVTKLGS